MSECPTRFKRYPTSKHTGYDACNCVQIASYDMGKQDCCGSSAGGSSTSVSVRNCNDYKRLPYNATGEIRTNPYEDLSTLYNSIKTPGSRLNGIRLKCNTNYDPFQGTFVDLWNGFIEVGLGGMIADICYEKKDRMNPGFLPAEAKQTLYPDNCECTEDTNPAA